MITRLIPEDVFRSPELPRKTPEPPRLSKLVFNELDLFISSDVTTLTAYCVLQGIPTTWPLDQVPINYNLDTVFDAEDELSAIGTLSGSINTSLITDGILTAEGTLSAGYNIGNILGETLIGTGTISGTLLLLNLRKNWAQWAKFGTVDFTKDKTNKSGDVPFDWNGYVWKILVLGGTPVAYGENGVSVMSKVSTKYGFTYGYKTIYTVGLKGKGAAVGTKDNSAHFFIDQEGQMWKLSDKLEMLDYSEFLSVLTGTKIAMSIDENNGFIYICDGTYGFIYNIRTGSMTSGPVNVSGIGVRDGSLYITAPATIAIPGFEKWTDIQDMRTRKTKTIEALEVGVDLSIAMQASIEWRMDKVTAFSRLPWVYVSPRGVAHLFCTGVEFRFGLKTATYADFEIDHLNIIGVINDN